MYAVRILNTSSKSSGSAQLVRPRGVLVWGESAFADQVTIAVDDGEVSQRGAAFEVVVVGSGAI
jgi:hypothetical protein